MASSVHNLSVIHCGQVTHALLLLKLCHASTVGLQTHHAPCKKPFADRQVRIRTVLKHHDQSRMQDRYPVVLLSDYVQPMDSYSACKEQAAHM